VHRSSGLLGRLRATWRVLLKEVGAFGVVGAFSFAVDLALFQLLYAHVGLGAVTAKVASTLVSTTVAYVGHRYWSFSHRGQLEPRRSFLLFTLINGGTLVLGAGIVAFVRYPLGQESVLVIQLANIASIVLGSVLRWLTYRWWVFPARPAADVVAEGGATQESTERSAA
jgi:putative flippase GtrA